MNLKKNLILLLILVVAAVVVVLVEKPFEDKTKKVREEAGLLFPDLETKEIKKLSIIRPANPQPTVLTKRDNDWYVVIPAEGSEEAVPADEDATEIAETAKPAQATKEPYPADENAVIEAIDKLKSLQAMHLASRNKEKHELFDVTEGKAIEVIAYGPDNQELAVLLIGKAGPDFFSTYIRKKNADDVYLYGQFLKGSFDRQPDNWRDRTIFDFDTQEVAGLTIATTDETIALQKSDNNLWQIQKPKACAADNTKVSMLLKSLATLKAGKFADEATLASSGLTEPQTTISITFKDGVTETLLIGDTKEENYFYATAGDKKYIYELYKNTVEKLTPALEEVEKSEPEPAAAPTEEVSSPPVPPVPAEPEPADAQ